MRLGAMVVTVTLLTAGCAVPVQTPPKTGVAVTFRWGFPVSYTQVWKDGELRDESVFQVNSASALRDEVKENPAAADKADTAHTLALAAIPTGVLGMGGLIAGGIVSAGGEESVTINGIMMTRVTDEDRRNLGIGIAIGGAAVVVAGAVMNLVAAGKIQDAVVEYNRGTASRRRFLAAPAVLPGDRGAAPGAVAAFAF